MRKRRKRSTLFIALGFVVAPFFVFPRLACVVLLFICFRCMRLLEDDLFGFTRVFFLSLPF